MQSRTDLRQKPLPPVSTRRLLAMAVPIILSQATETVMMFADRLFLSRVSLVHLAAGMSGGLASFVFGAVFIGMAGYMNTLVAHCYGSGRREDGVHAASQGLYLALGAYPIILLLIPLISPLFRVIGHSPAQVALETPYFGLLMSGSIFVLLRSVFAGYFTGIGHTRLVLAANATGMVINVPLNWLLIFGVGPFPELGIVGAALGTIGGSATAAGVLIVAFLRRPEVRTVRREEGLSGLLRFRRDLFGRLLRFGFPVGFEMFLNVFAFNLFLQLMHAYSELVAAAITIVFSFDIVSFIPMVGMGVAVSALVGQEQGAGRPEGARKVTRLALRMTLGYAILMGLVFVFGAPWLTALFAPGSDAFSREVEALARIMLRMAALYTMADATQLVFAGSLRGAGDTRAVMVINSSLHWLMAVLAVVGIVWLRLDPLVMWGLFIGSLIVIGVGMILRYRTGRWESIRLLEYPSRDGLPSDPYEDAWRAVPLEIPEI
ncbi:MATE family efflux transporter [Spirochaeta africana]|uniref:Multidrug-efflux transporter n=1 Tax=Spirochaeta africana (strain ATCC 700263 / DSM 8902 / Z-7692) TaxID=889378 RepID=H9UMG4_SPIAZ|nr:MATE family efflux transporter [Spirochaeta africana]AFG38707.1 putative efflux protein, MATE family [Spirochaeta africana DSM 8902]